MPKFKKFSPTDEGCERAALLIHGGCFTDGDETWNKEQADSIAKACGLDVFTLDFSKNSYAESLRDIRRFFRELHEDYSGQVGLIGCSSGGYLALNVLKEESMPLPQFVALICPVMHPEKREDLLLESGAKHALSIQSKQLRYFKEKPYPSPFYGTRTPLTVIAARDDENVAFSLIASEVGKYRHIQLHTIEGTHSHSYKISPAVNELLVEVTRVSELTSRP